MTRCRVCDKLSTSALCDSCRRYRDHVKSQQRGGWEWDETRRRVKDRDGWMCVVPEYGAHRGKLVVDHIIPLAEGGTNDLDNLRTLCEWHHRTRKQWENRAYVLVEGDTVWIGPLSLN